MLSRKPACVAFPDFLRIKTNSFCAPVADDLSAFYYIQVREHENYGIKDKFRRQGSCKSTLQ